MKIGDICRRGVVSISNDADVATAAQLMRERHVGFLGGIRRVPVVDGRGALTGIFAIDDALGFVSNLLCDIAESVKNGQRQEWHARRA